MTAHHKGRFWRTCRVCFRRFRIFVWLLVLAALALLIYVNQVGLPDFVKRPLLEKLKERGLDLQFSRLRLSWYQGIVAENVHFGPVGLELSPNLNVAEVQVRLNWDALAHLQLQVDSLMLRQGHVSWAFAEPKGSLPELSVANIQTDLRFLPDDQWALDHFRAQFAGADIQLSGVVTNASAVRDWKIFQGQQPASRTAKLWQDRLRHLAETLEHIHFSGPPALRIYVRGDALDLHTFNMLLSLSAPGAETPWGRISDGRFAARLFSVDTNGLSRVDLDLHAIDAQTKWASITNLSLNMRVVSVDGQTNLVSGELKLTAAQAQTQWAKGSNALFTATWTHSITNPIPISGLGTFSCAFAETSWGSASDIQLRGSLATASDANSNSSRDQSRAWWTNLEPYQLSWNVRAADLKSPKLVADRVSCAGSWQTPSLVITNLEADLLQGHLGARGDLDVATRVADLSLASDLDPHRMTTFLPEVAQKFLSEFSWPKAPQVNAELSVTLPEWTNRAPDWQGQVLPTLQLRSEFNLEKGATYRNVTVTSARSHVLYSNLCLELPDLSLTRPEGRLAAEVKVDGRTRDFYSRLSSTIDPGILRPFVGEGAGSAFDLFKLTQSPAMKVEIRGRGNEPERTGLQGQLVVTNFTFRGEAFTLVQTRFDYTNECLRFLQPRIEIGSGYLTGDGLMVDLGAELVYITNGFSTAEPMVVARAIGPHIAQAIEDYKFSSPPTARVYGKVPLHGEELADLHFDLTGGPFHWWKFNIPHITGHVHWAGLHLSLTNLQAEFYHGSALGWAAFDFPETRGTDFRFDFSTTNVLLHALMTDLWSQTNHLEGRLYGNLAVTRANSDSWQTVFGYGEAHLRDGLLWDIPLFGKFSPVLNGISPGLGNSRASAATASFIITNGVIRSTDLDIRSTAMRLEYRGTVNLENQINARVDAELMRDMWLVGPLVSTVFWPVTKLFEYKVTGNLADPRTEPVFIVPKIMLMPFHPLRTLKGLRPEDPNSNPNFSPLPP